MHYSISNFTSKDQTLILASGFKGELGLSYDFYQDSTSKIGLPWTSQEVLGGPQELIGRSLGRVTKKLQKLVSSTVRSII